MKNTKFTFEKLFNPNSKTHYMVYQEIKSFMLLKISEEFFFDDMQAKYNYYSKISKEIGVDFNTLWRIREKLLDKTKVRFKKRKEEIFCTMRVEGITYSEQCKIFESAMNTIRLKIDLIAKKKSLLNYLNDYEHQRLGKFTEKLEEKFSIKGFKWKKEHFL